MILYCDAAECVHCVNGHCRLESITLYDCTCGDYANVTDGPDYQEAYFIACEHRPEGGGAPILYRQMRRGKRIERAGRVFYTQEDIRGGIVFATFTEAQSGLLVKGEDLINDALTGPMEERIQKTPPVLSLPWMDYHYGEPPTPHVEAGACGADACPIVPDDLVQ